jgi:LuxR family maltose regulon positive regulatory protein
VHQSVLTPKQLEVLQLVAQGLSNKEIARAVHVGEETVKWHLRNLRERFSVGSRKHVVARARLLGYLEVSS